MVPSERGCRCGEGGASDLIDFVVFGIKIIAIVTFLFSFPHRCVAG